MDKYLVGAVVFATHFIQIKSEKSVHTLRHYFTSVIKRLLLIPRQQYIKIHTYEIYYDMYIHYFKHDDNRVGNASSEWATMAEEEGCNSKLPKITFLDRRGGAWHCHTAALEPFSPDCELRPCWVTHCANFWTKECLLPQYIYLLNISQRKPHQPGRRWQKPTEATDDVQPKMLSSCLAASIGESGAGERQWLEGACATGAQLLAPNSRGALGVRTAAQLYQPAAFFFPCNFMPLIRSPHLHDKSSPSVHIHLKEGANHPCAQTQLSRAECMWDGAGDAGCHGNPPLSF